MKKSVQIRAEPNDKDKWSVLLKKSPLDASELFHKALLLLEKGVEPGDMPTLDQQYSRISMCLTDVDAVLRKEIEGLQTNMADLQKEHKKAQSQLDDTNKRLEGFQKSDFLLEELKKSFSEREQELQIRILKLEKELKEAYKYQALSEANKAKNAVLRKDLLRLQQENENLRERLSNTGSTTN